MLALGSELVSDSVDFIIADNWHRRPATPLITIPVVLCSKQYNTKGVSATAFLPSGGSISNLFGQVLSTARRSSPDRRLPQHTCSGSAESEASLLRKHHALPGLERRATAGRPLPGRGYSGPEEKRGYVSVGSVSGCSISLFCHPQTLRGMARADFALRRQPRGLTVFRLEAN